MTRACKNSSLRSGLTVLSFLVTTACSLGTEVGNGLKPGNPGSTGSGQGPDSVSNSSEQAPKNASAPFASVSDDGLFTPFNNGESFWQVAANDGGGQTDPQSKTTGPLSSGGVLAGGTTASSLIVAGIGTASGSGVSIPRSVSELEKIKSDLSADAVAITDSQLTKANLPLLMVDLAFTGCGSPLAELSTGAAALQLSISGVQRGKIEIKAAADQSRWEIRGSDGVLIRTVTPIALSNSGVSIRTVSASDASGTVLRPISICSDFTSTPDVTLDGKAGKFTKKTVKLATSKGYSYLVWYQDGVAGSGKVVRVSLTGQADSTAPYAIFQTP